MSARGTLLWLAAVFINAGTSRGPFWYLGRPAAHHHVGALPAGDPDLPDVMSGVAAQ